MAVYRKHTHTHMLLSSFLILQTPSICPTEVQKVAGVALLTTHQQKKIYNPPNSFSTTEPFPLCSSNDDRCFTCPQHQTHVAFSNTNDMVSSLCRAHLLTLTLVLVFFPLHIYMESVVCLCSVGGFCPFVWKRHQTRPEGHMMAWTWLRRLFFVLWHCHWPQLSFFLSSFDGKLHHKAEKRKVAQMSSLFFLGQMLPNVFTVCWLLQVMLKVFFMMNTFLAYPMCVLNTWWLIFTYLVKKLMEFALL